MELRSHRAMKCRWWMGWRWMGERPRRNWRPWMRRKPFVCARVWPSVWGGPLRAVSSRRNGRICVRRRRSWTASRPCASECASSGGRSGKIRACKCGTGTVSGRCGCGCVWSARRCARTAGHRRPPDRRRVVRERASCWAESDSDALWPAPSGWGRWCWSVDRPETRSRDLCWWKVSSRLIGPKTRTSRSRRLSSWTAPASGRWKRSSTACRAPKMAPWRWRHWRCNRSWADQPWRWSIDTWSEERHLWALGPWRRRIAVPCLRWTWGIRSAAAVCWAASKSDQLSTPELPSRNCAAPTGRNESSHRRRRWTESTLCRARPPAEAAAANCDWNDPTGWCWTAKAAGWTAASWSRRRRPPCSGSS